MTPGSSQNSGAAGSKALTGSTTGLPHHDEIGGAQRAFELSSIAAAGSLLAYQVFRLALMPPGLTRWQPLAVAAGMVSADFASGLVHWTADTWGSETMPLLGRRFLRPFRVHHVNPDDFLRRDFIDTNGDVSMLVIPALTAACCIPLDSAVGASAAIYLVGFAAAGWLTNQVHQWAHMPHPPRGVRWLQDRGVILGRLAHQQHHRPPYSTNYCIATGWLNRPLGGSRLLSQTGVVGGFPDGVTTPSG